MKIARKPDGFSLVEVTLALGIATFCLLVLFALIPVGLSTKKETIQYTVASGIASEVVADLRVMSRTATKSGRFEIDIPAAGSTTMVTNPTKTFFLSENGTASSTLLPISVYRVSVGMASPANTSKSSTPVRIVVSWPAQAYPNTSTWPSKLNDSYEVVTFLDRN